MPQILLPLLFWLTLVMLFYTYLGYPLLIYFLGRLFLRRSVNPNPPQTRSVTVILAVHNEEQRISQRLENLLSSDYPKDKLEIVVVDDGCTDATGEKVRNFGDSRIRLIVQPERSGKAKCLNVAAPLAKGELVVFADVRQRFAPDTIAALVKHFTDPCVGAVSGSLVIDPAASNIGTGVDVYWRLEKFIRLSESQWDSCIGCTGAVYAIRRALFKTFPADTLLDDVVIPMGIAVQGYRVLFDSAALAYDAQTLEPKRERVRKQRTLAGNYQMLFRHPGWLLPWRNRLWWQLISHKYLRLTGPWLMILLFVTNGLLTEQSLYRVLFLGQVLFYLLAAGGAVSPVKTALLSIPTGFVFLNLMAFAGLRHYLRGSYQEGKWPVTDIQPATPR
jgi:cellulose synthase/poly-beta-1,6-N-acetylglucosamine synthase-like glycosyltransferase